MFGLLKKPNHHSRHDEIRQCLTLLSQSDKNIELSTEQSIRLVVSPLHLSVYGDLKKYNFVVCDPYLIGDYALLMSHDKLIKLINVKLCNRGG